MIHLTLEQRYKIETCRNLGKEISEIPEYIGKDKSVVRRGIKRNSDGRSGLYNADFSHRKTVLRKKIKKNTRFSQQMHDYVLRCLNEHYSLEQTLDRQSWKMWKWSLINVFISIYGRTSRQEENCIST